jgi:hypothetical protein
MMLVCARLRGLALHSPELWALINVCWPVRWITLCSARAADAPLHLICRIHDAPSAHTTARLLPRARDALLLIQQVAGDGPYEPVDLTQPLRTVLQAHASPRSLKIKNGDYSVWTNVRRRAAMTLHSHTLGGARSTVTHLSLEHLCLGEDLPIFPSLERLRLHAVVPPADPAWLHRLLASSERLRSLSLSDISSTPLQIDLLLFCPSALPCLANSAVSAKIEVVLSLLQLLPTPSRELYIFVAGWESVEDDYIPAPVTPHQCEDLLAYVQHFWRATSGPAPLPTAKMEVDQTDDSYGNRVLRMTACNRLSVTIRHSRVPEAAPFLPYVRHCDLKVLALDDALVPSVWPELDAIPTLEQLFIEPVRCRSPTQAIGVQAWADARARAGLPPVQVAIRQRLRTDNPACTGPWCTRVVWNPNNGPLAEAEWTDINGELSDPFDEDDADEAAMEEDEDEDEDEDE